MTVMYIFLGLQSEIPLLLDSTDDASISDYASLLVCLKELEINQVKDKGRFKSTVY
jgi:hypothetical protein